MSNVTIERDSRATGTPRLQALTGLRFFAVLLVVLHHFWAPPARVPSGVPAFLWEGLRTLASHGFIGVSLFFVLSGFVLTYTYDREGPALSRRRFWAARLARIYPMYLLALIVAFPDLVRDLSVLVQKYGATLGTAWGLLKGAMVLGLVQSWLPSCAMFWNAPAWSLSAEAFFYLLFPTVLATRWYRTLTVRGACKGLAIVGALVLALDGVMYGVHLTHPTLDLYAVIGMAPIFRLPEFLAGILLGRAFLGLDPLGSRARRVAGWASALAVGAFLLLNAGLRVPPELLIALNLPLVLAMVGGLAVGSGPVAALMSRPWALLLGEASYGIYLLHVPIGNRFAEISGAPYGHLSWWAFAGCLFMTALVSCLLFRYYEDPLRRRLRRVLVEAFGRKRSSSALEGGG